MNRELSIDKMVLLAKRLNQIVAQMEQRKRALMSIGYGEG